MLRKHLPRCKKHEPLASGSHGSTGQQGLCRNQKTVSKHTAIMLYITHTLFLTACQFKKLSAVTVMNHPASPHVEHPDEHQ